MLEKLCVELVGSALRKKRNYGRRKRGIADAEILGTALT